LFASAVFFATIAFFIAAGARLYHDLKAIAAELGVAANDLTQPATAPLANRGASAID
jgi:hypothetical protein